jgi:cytochrome P450
LPGYNVTTPLGADGALFSLLDPATHARRRKLWDPAFTAEARKVYEPMLVVRVNELVQHLRERAGVPLDLAEWLSLLAMDFMGDFEFSGGLETMRDGADVAGIRRTIEEGLSIQEALGMVPWVRGLITLLPSKKAQDFYDLGLSIAERRRAAGGTSKDLMYHLVSRSAPSPEYQTSLTEQAQLGEGDDTRARPPMSRLTFSLEAALALGGGSDTTAVSLANVFFYLLTNPRVFTKLRAALDAAAGEFADFDVDIDLAQLREIPYLEGVM